MRHQNWSKKCLRPSGYWWRKAKITRRSLSEAVEKEVIATIISPSRNCHDFHNQLWESFTSLKVTQLWEDAGRSDKVEEERLLNNSKNKATEFLKFYCKKKGRSFLYRIYMRGNSETNTNRRIVKICIITDNLMQSFKQCLKTVIPLTTLML